MVLMPLLQNIAFRGLKIVYLIPAFISSVSDVPELTLKWPRNDHCCCCEQTTLRVWDVLFNEGAKVLFHVALAIFKVRVWIPCLYGWNNAFWLFGFFYFTFHKFYNSCRWEKMIFYGSNILVM
jgi:hypothetical protein